jgi:hypothetical protein
VVHALHSNVVSTVFDEAKMNQGRDDISTKPLFDSPLHRFVLDDGKQ